MDLPSIIPVKFHYNRIKKTFIVTKTTVAILKMSNAIYTTRHHKDNSCEASDQTNICFTSMVCSKVETSQNGCLHTFITSLVSI